ncbi:alpha/beta fold hydrolase [Legionella sainthelensi]|uniref:Alpha/beta hydrolase n=1 Tax=Legionella sainthelensi TaxID=28087 RepID=A0A2H5FMA6_9GAMM|nr:alpha/beta hydrolase [Legionella sainthelensi]
MKEHSHHNHLCQINYAEGPNHGMPLLLLHGATHRWQSLTPITDELCTCFHVYAPDFRGHGSSQKIRGHYFLEDYLADTQSFIQEVIKEPVLLIGHSLGGMIGSMLTASQPSLVRALILIDPPLNLNSLRQLTIGFKDQINLLVQGLRLSRLGLPIHQFIPEQVRHCDPEMLLAMTNQFDEVFKPYKVERFFKQINHPTLLLHGNSAHGSLVSGPDIKRLLDIKHDLVHVEIPNAGHSPIRQNTEATLNAILQFMEKERLITLRENN